MREASDRVSLIRCGSYDYAEVKAAVAAAIDQLGGLESYIDRSKTVLLKPNLLMKKSPEEATTTHPAVVAALAELLIGYGVKVIIGDSPGGLFSEAALRGVYDACGMTEAAAKTGAVLNFNIKSFKSPSANDFPGGLLLTDMLNDADYVISVSKMKTHGMMTFTGAVKNMFGTVPGTHKAQYHLRFPGHQDFAEALVDICLAAAPVLSFMDGITAMEGAGPSGGQPRHMGLIAASPSPFALDRAVIDMIGLAPGDVPTVKCSVDRGLACQDLNAMDFTGESVSAFAAPGFDVPKARSVFFVSKRIPTSLSRFLSALFQPRPVFDDRLCTRCAACARNCPPKVIEMKGGGPEVDYSGCIRCFCCQELCPQKAISIRKAPLNMLGGNRRE